MTIEEFRNKVIEELIEKEGKDYEITAYDAVKNNGLLLHGINVKREGNNVSPTIYIDGYYKRFEEGLSIENIVEKIWKMLH